MEHFKAVVLVILVFVTVNAHGWFHSENKCRNHHAGRTMYPYKFGATNLNCLMGKNKKGKRSAAPSVFSLSYSHSFIYYRGYYIEYFGTAEPDTDISFVETYPQPADEDCDSQTNDDVAGYGVLSIDCIRRCGQQFVDEREYSILGNNCHDFANYISDILCHQNECPCP